MDARLDRAKPCLGLVMIGNSSVVGLCKIINKDVLMLKKSCFYLYGFALLLSNLVSFPVLSNDKNRSETLYEGEVSDVVSAITDLLDKNYIFPDVSQEIGLLIQKKLNQGEYDKYGNGQEFAQQLTLDLQSISHDRHLRVYFDPKRVEEMRQQEAQGESDDELLREQQLQRSKNYGFNQVSILNGNIGYIDLRSFSAPEEVARPLAAAMQFVENTDAIIFDLRKNGGGYPATVQLMVSYLLGPESIHLNNIYKRKENQTRQYWSVPTVEGKRRPDVDVYVLTSSSTFSAAEDFSYTLKHLNRATIVGETTGGGAHPGGREIATDRFLVWTPTARSINPVTGTNWEGTGVIPHVKVSAEKSLETAHQLALEKIVKDGSGVSSLNQWHLTSLRAMSESISIDTNILKKYQGNYGIRTLTFEDGQLYYQRKGNNKYRLIPMNDELFMLDGKDDFRIKIIVKDDEAIAIQGISDDGSTSQNARDSA